MACPFYRERWVGDDEVDEGRTVLYHVICLQNTPPATIDEQQCCLEAKAGCWRFRAGRKRRPLADDDEDAFAASDSAGQPISV